MLRDLIDRVSRIIRAYPRRSMACAGGVVLIGIWSGSRAPMEVQQHNWIAVQPLIRGAEMRSEQAVNDQVAKVEAFFDIARTRVPAFAEAIVGSEGKLQAGNAVLEGGVNALAELFGEKPVYSRDSFRDYADRSFRQMVLDPAQLREVIHGATNGWKARAQEIRFELASVLSADLGDPDISGRLATLESEIAGADRSGAAVDQAIDVAVENMFVASGTYLLSWVIGDAVEGMVVGENSSFLERQVVNSVASSGIEEAIGMAMRSAGRDPRSQLSAKVDALLVNMRALVIDGDPAVAGEYDAFVAMGKTHPDASARAACSAAADALLVHANVGLRRRLTGLHEADVRAWKAELGASDLEDSSPFGAEASVAVPPVDAQTAIASARACCERFGKTLP